MPESVVVGVVILLVLGFGIFFGYCLRDIQLEWQHDCMPHDHRCCHVGRPRYVEPSHDD